MERDPEYASQVREVAKLRKRERSTDEKKAEWREYMRRRRADNPDLVARERAYINEARQRDIVKFLIRGAKHRAIKRGYEFDLTLAWARDRWTGKCEMTGLPFDWSKPMLHAFSPSLDRIDSGAGYTQRNCRFILQAVNAFKGSSSDGEMLRIARALAQGGES
jgi:hypothetical protein